MITTIKFRVQLTIAKSEKGQTKKITLPLSGSQLQGLGDWQVKSLKVVENEFAVTTSDFVDKLFSEAKSPAEINHIVWSINELTDHEYYVQALQIGVLGIPARESLRDCLYDFHPVSLETFGMRLLSTINLRLCGLTNFAADLLKISVDYEKLFQVFIEKNEIIVTSYGVYVKSGDFHRRLLTYC